MTGGAPRLGAGDPCPSCRGTSGSIAGEQGYACAVCGCPRILVDPPVRREGREGPLLVEAKSLAERRVGWGVAGAIGAFGAVVAGAGAGLVALFADLGPSGQSLLGAAVLAPLLLAAGGFLRVRRTTGQIAHRLDEAALIVTTELAQAEGGHLNADSLARRLHVPAARAEELVARAHVEGMLAPESAALRLRVEDHSPDGDHAIEPVEGEPEREKGRRDA